MNSKLLDGVEARICTLEENVLPTDGDDTKLLKVLSDVDDTLKTFSSKRERFNQVFKRVPAIVEYLSPGFLDTISKDNEYEKEMVLSAEKDLVEMAKQLEEIQKLSGLLDSKKISEVPNFRPRLHKLELVQHQQLDDLSRTSEELENLVTAYNELVTCLSENFVKWDWTLSQLESKEETQ